MKKIHIVGLLMILGAIVVLMTAAKDLSTYDNFKSAGKATGAVKVVGKLCKDKEIIYDPRKDPNYLSFYVQDNNNEIRKVVLKNAKPRDFEMSEQIVLTGTMKGDEFLASDMLLKCPSKYKDEEIYVKSRS
ncbi:MAG TPA: cytochrome c maturation protein CcmE [Saprospiraceae bacterium]|jgi:cytochrome c-type biogenesis protein CcmE|nr:cytochrome c maturation protein CcmE [Saprospiraceae bacterium]MCC6688551.1 cytochrome c maturation protein CcmE [Saprospiraceae bacterium]HMX83293.1 cytochrome c maturation protein CcmE [Saprospiraceae bacterium]HMX86153.1 cytochrome c maturation protein CcmE [Saprospiraceae bacterium]HMZ73929.1 cytochrome c maturation protein CcmE [Saprospiraceae bacterium]